MPLIAYSAGTGLSIAAFILAGVAVIGLFVAVAFLRQREKMHQVMRRTEQLVRGDDLRARQLALEKELAEIKAMREQIKAGEDHRRTYWPGRN